MCFVLWQHKPDSNSSKLAKTGLKKRVAVSGRNRLFPSIVLLHSKRCSTKLPLRAGASHTQHNLKCQVFMYLCSVYENFSQ